MSDLLGNTVTFLFTDIEGSTRLWDAHPGPMRLALARHDTLLRQIFTDHRGEVFKTIGDAFCVAFGQPADAVLAALEAQQALQREAWEDPIQIRVRMAIHCGAVERRDNDYFGPPLNRVARLLGLAAGRQVLLSHSVKQLCEDGLPRDVSMISLGEHMLRDLARPEQVFQLAHPLLPSEFPPLKSVSARPATNLPQQLTSFIGREREIAEVAALLQSARLLTITGNGGCGKTRLALQLAGQLVADYADGVWLVELEAVRDPRGVAEALALTFNISRTGEGDLRRQVAEALRGRHLLLVLDNFEQVVDAATVIQELLNACPRVSFVITSRERLRITGEQEYPLDPFAVPAADEVDVDWSRFESVQLFAERCRALNPGFAITAANGPVLGELCRRLDGIPLAIELAAARTRAMTPQQILQRLTRRLDLLTSTLRDLPQRQRTLRGAMDWSYDLLTEDERAIFAELAVFSGGFALEAAEEVCLTFGAFDAVFSLHDKSLLRTEESQGATRFFMLETVRDYALEKLQQTAAPDDIRDRHAEFFLRRAEEFSRQLAGTEAVEAMEGFRIERYNLREGMDWSIRQGQDTRIVAYGKALFAFLRHRGLYEECERRLEAAYEAAVRCGDHASEARLLNQRGLIAWDRAQLERAQELFTASYTSSERMGDRGRMLVSGTNLGNVAWSRADITAAIQQWQNCLDLAITTKQPRLEGTVRTSLGMAYSYLHRFSEAYHEFDLARALQTQAENTEGLAYLLLHSCEPLKRQGRFAEAIARLRESRTLFERLESIQGIAGAEVELGHNLLKQGDYVEAESCLGHSLKLATEISHQPLQVAALQNLGRLSMARSRLEQAAVYFIEAFALGRQIESRMNLAEILDDLSLLRWQCADYGTAYFFLCIAAREFNRVGLPEGGSLASRREVWRAEIADAEEIEQRAEKTSLYHAMAG